MEPYSLNQLITPTILFFIALFIRGIFSFLETSVTALRLFKLKELARLADRYATLLQTLEKNPHRVLITILIANSLADVTTAALAIHIMENLFAHLGFSSGLGFTFGIAVASVCIIIFGEILPKSFAKGRGERAFRSMLWLINLVFYAFYPLVTTLIRLSNFLIYKIGGMQALESGRQWISSEREIQFLINYIHEKGIIELEKTEMLQSIFELGRTPVKEIMVSATDIISVAINTPIKEILEVFAKHQFTRLPVYQEKIDNIVGMIHQKDIFVMFSRGKEKALRDLIRKIMFVPESMKVNQLLREFRQKQMHIAIVINEHGIIIGLITLEDILEEIVGEISDEHEPALEKIMPLKKGGWLVDATVSLEDLGVFLGIKFESEDSVSLGGFLTEYLQHLPKQGKRILYKDYYFQVQKASPRRVLQVLIFEKQNTAKPTDT